MQGAFSHCEALVRANDKERFIATLFAPAERRAAILALYAFNLEVARVREVAREPLAGEIRLQWWSEVLAGERRDEGEGHPVAAALSATIEAYALPRDRFQAVVDARRFDLYNEPMQTLADLEAYGEAVSASLILLSGLILGVGQSAQVAGLARHAGLAYAISGLLAAFPIHARRGQLFMPLEILQRHGVNREAFDHRPASSGLKAGLAELRLVARQHLARAGELLPGMPAALLPALLPVALTGLVLARMERDDYDPFATVEIPPWRRQWLIWRAARRPERLFVS